MSHRPWHQETKTIDLFIPFASWFKRYSEDFFKKDALAGVTVAAILTPQAIAYALLAGLPPIVGFYAALVGAVVASLWGSSPKLSTGPVAILSLLVFSALAPMAEPQSATYVMLAGALAILSGATLFFLGLMRFGFIMRAIPHSVITGFATAAAIIIAITQLPLLFGFAAERNEFILPTIGNIAFGIIDTNGITALVGIVSVAILLLFKRFSARIPAALFVFVIMTAASYFFRFDELGVAVVGSVPATLPTFDFPILPISDWLELLSKSWIIALVGFVESYAIARSIGEKGRKRIDVNQELVGQGLANIATGLFKGYPVCGSFSRTAVNISSGAQTGMASVFAAIIVCIGLFLITPVFSYIPLAVLAAIVMVSVLDLVDMNALRGLYRMSRTDGIVALTTFSVAIILKPDDAVAVGVIVALVLFIRRIVWARVRVLGIDSEWGILQGIGTTETVETYEGVLIMRIETAAFYGNIDHIIHAIDNFILEEERMGNRIQAVVFDCSSIHYIDLSGAETMRHYFESLHEEGMKVYGIYMHTAVVERLNRVGASSFFTQVHNIKEMRAALSLPEPSREAENIVESGNEDETDTQ